ncbi:ubiquinone/menaquinone biosynthesis C-methylase UbiE [Clostridium saccharoperbutylacetonicum]|uniref:Methylase involved in ubiquinone/menaquinone biosynthesis n=1 Tax=Clostridium saccharoperbutylacetonicum N1-4(HMT) TaxID=931276 RepID=M1MJI4_9CLOT|nr:class I SAM-dependent methyltransferase [Clostridium saccharoperbutylacetonicum]AGF58094.1 methylase involved in ubiquinone/menaquinone biosynthesis [Clostridium saccharoperbutylacetonicum N1-4(HMT)]NRT61132.1 ubiquinone/menaquinone biosynthesis C-methylase UbiE [Clostridium saccharoperbutylacetonicum]NSB24447.1 ubiquinone/menaquinone biosynthesis C-methylase UbiE [Clostridium saccharoperbutylacetonicum]NSB43823.1 ubiquinone/menaquinone biosynthesis C-methylase UbiE [Clostridium saccharoperb
MASSKNIFKENSKNNFNKHAEIYDESDDGKFVAPMYGEIISRIISEKPKRVLDLGCGTGNVLKRLKENKEIVLSGLDLSENMIEIAKKNVGDRAELKVGDAEYIPWNDDTFDVIVCNASFHHYPNPEKVLLEMKRVLKKNGTLIIGDPTCPIMIRQILNIFCKLSNNGDYRIYSKKEIEEMLLRCGFEPSDFKMINWKSFAINAKIVG